MTSRMKTIETERGKPIQQIITDLYNSTGSVYAVADNLGVSQSTVSLWILKLGLVFRTVLVDPEVETYSLTSLGKQALSQGELN